MFLTLNPLVKRSHNSFVLSGYLFLFIRGHISWNVSLWRWIKKINSSACHLFFKKFIRRGATNVSRRRRQVCDPVTFSVAQEAMTTSTTQFIARLIIDYGNVFAGINEALNFKFSHQALQVDG